MKKFFSNAFKVLLPLLISAVVLAYTYRDYDFSKLWSDVARLNLWWIFFAVAHTTTNIKNFLSSCCGSDDQTKC